MKEIKLNKSNWFYDESKPLGKKGGFGQVFYGEDNDHKEVAVKKLFISTEDAGHRELKLADELSSNQYEHVIDILDSGIDAETEGYFIVMAKAEHSLQDIIDKSVFTEEQSIDVLFQIASGLYEVKHIVHRDLKPDNVLFEENKWQIADFGIAKFVEDSTSINTLKECLSVHYAAPEQWRYEKTSNATDIYSLGCIAHALIKGEPPFIGSVPHELRRKHLNSEPPKLEIQPQFKQLVSLCLRKSAEARPSIESVIKQLERIKSKPSKLHSIAIVASDIAEKIAQDEVEKIKTQTQLEKRRQIAKDAFVNLRMVIEDLIQQITNEAQVAIASKWSVKLGSGAIKYFEPFSFIREESFNKSGLDVICGAVIKVEQDDSDYIGRASNLWYMKRGDSYRWYEVAYWSLGENTRLHKPFAIENGQELIDADFAASNIMHPTNQAFNPKIVDGEYSDAFIERWANRLAAAAKRNLQRPSRLPEN